MDTSFLPHCPPLPHHADKSTPALSTPATWCRIVHSCNIHPCHIVLICPLLQSPPLQHGAELSTHALSTLAISCRYVHSCIFHTPIFYRAALSTPANSINPTGFRFPSELTSSLQAGSWLRWHKIAYVPLLNQLTFVNSSPASSLACQCHYDLQHVHYSRFHELELHMSLEVVHSASL